MSSINSMDDMSIMNTGNNNSEGAGYTANRENYFQNSKTTNYYIVEFTEIYKKKVAVEADSSSDAEKKIRNAWIEQEDPAVDNPAFYTAEYKVGVSQKVCWSGLKVTEWSTHASELPGLYA